MLSAYRPVRWGGLAAVAAGALYVGSTLFSYLGGDTLSTLASALGSLLLLGGLVGLHARHAGSYGRLGTTGFLLAFVGALFGTALGPVMTLGVDPAGGAPSPAVRVLGIIGLVGLIGLLLLGVAILRAKVLALPWRALPRAIFAVHVLSPFLIWLVFVAARSDTAAFVFVPGTLAVLPGVGWMLLGYVLWSGAGARRAAPVV